MKDSTIPETEAEELDGRLLRVGELARRVGVAASTVRSWEERYGFPRPVRRTRGGHRLYSDRDVAQLRTVRDLVAEGRSIASAVTQVTGPDLERGPDPSDDPASLAPALAALRAIARAPAPAEVVAALVRFVEAVGGSVVPARHAGPDAIPVDLSFGEGEPVLAVAEPVGVARLRLESVLPALVEDARVAVARLWELERLREREEARGARARRPEPG